MDNILLEGGRILRGCLSINSFQLVSNHKCVQKCTSLDTERCLLHNLNLSLMNTLATFIHRWEINQVEFFLEAFRESIGFKINAHGFVLLNEAYQLIPNFEKQNRASYTR